MGWTLRPRIDIGPSECARKGDVGLQSQVSGGTRRKNQLVHRPNLSRLRVPTNLFWSEPVEHGVVGGVTSDELALQVSRKLRNYQAMASHDGRNLIAVG